MKKLVLAAALASAFAGSAFAQSSVTLYGRINTSVEFQDNESVDKTVMSNNASRWGLRGTEDLGGGLNAFFQLEAGFGSDTGAGSGGFSRESFVGLKSASLGQIKVGFITSALYYSTLDYIGVFNHDTGTTSEDNLYGLYYTSSRGIAVTPANAVEYTSPSFGGFSVALTATAGEGTTDKTYEGVLNFDQGDLHIGAGYSETKNVADVSVDKLFSVAASYVFGPVTAGLSYQNDDTTAFGKRDSVTGTAMYTLGASEFHVSVGWAGEWDNVANSDALQYTLGYNYNLSKRTKVYAFYYAIDNNDFVYGPGFALANATSSAIGVGIRHNF